MTLARRAARLKLRGATRDEYDAIVHAANLTQLQTRILRLHIQDGLPLVAVALKVSKGESTVRRKLGEAYDKINKMSGK